MFKKLSYRSYLLNSIICIATVLADIDFINSINYDDELGIQEANMRLGAVNTALKKILDSGDPLSVDKDSAVITNQRQSLLSDICGILYNVKKVTPSIVTVEHNAVNLIRNNSVNEKEKDRFAKILDLILVHNGIQFDGKHYVMLSSNNSQLKVGKAVFVLDSVAERIQDALNIASLEEVNAAGGDNGSEYLKRIAVKATPSAVLFDDENNPVTVEDIIMMDDVEVSRVFNSVFEIDPVTGNRNYYKQRDMKVTLFDGQFLLFKRWMPSGQYRGYDLKGFGIQSTKVLETLIANGELDPEKEFTDIDGHVWKIKDVFGKILATKSIWKGSKLGLSWSETVNRLNKLSEKYPTINTIRVVRSAASELNIEGEDQVDDLIHEVEEPEVRYMSRQANQQFLFATDSEIQNWIKGSVRHINKNQDALKFAKNFAGDNEVLQSVIELYPEVLAADQVMYDAHAKYISAMQNAARGRIRVHGVYPYICMDPVAMIRILVGGSDPETEKGIILANNVCVGNFENGVELYTVRYPANHIVGKVVRNMVLDIFSEIGDVAVLSVNDDLIVRMDGDFDGDEALFTDDAFVIEQCKRMYSELNIPLITFAHDKAARFAVDADRKNLMNSVAASLYNGQKFNLVGTYSNLACKILAKLNLNSDRNAIRAALQECAYAHVGTILVIDAVKTGKIPEGLSNILNSTNKNNKRMPWNQRFTGGIHKTWDDARWDTQKEGRSVADRIARAVLNGTNNGEFSYDRHGMEFDVRMLMNAEFGSNTFSGVVDNEVLKSIKYDKQDSAVAKAIKAGEKVKPQELMLFLFKNAAALERSLSENPDSEDIRLEYYKTVKQILMDLDDRQNVWQLANSFIANAFEVKRLDDGTVKKLKSNKVCTREDATELEIHAEKGRYVRFILNVFSDEVLANLKRNMLNF